MLENLILALSAALLVGVVPGWFWTIFMLGRSLDLVERITFSIAFSLALVPPVALVIMWVSGTGVTLLVAALAPLIVFTSGLAARLLLGPAQIAEDRQPALPTPSLDMLVLLALLPVLGVVLWTTIDAAPVATSTIIAAVSLVFLVLLAGTLILRGSRLASKQSLFPIALTTIMVTILVRGYVGPVRYDWPYLRGGDQYNHAVQANEMLAVGNYDAFLVYPPGFSTLTASISRIAGLEPLEVFPVLAPALILLPPLACYALAKNLWGRWAGLSGAAFSGLMLNGVWDNIVDARYPNLVSAQFLLVLVVAALIRLYRSPEPRAALTLALLGSSVVLYHSVGAFYTALLLAPVAAIFMPLSFLMRHYRRGLALLFSLTLLGTLSVLYAWDTYDLGRLLGGLLTDSETGAGGEAVSIVVGTQPVFPLAGLPDRVSLAVLTFGIMGLLLLFVPSPGWNNLPGWLSRATLLLWCGILFAGSRTAMSGFPQRFERDLGIPLSILAALAFAAILGSLASHAASRRQANDTPATRSVTTNTTATFGAAAGAMVAILALFLAGTQTWSNLKLAATPEPASTLTPELAEAGNWLLEHNFGGRILPVPSYGPLTSRGMLALGGYHGLQAYPERRVNTPRSLPPSGAQEIKDAAWMLSNPQGKRTRNIVDRYDLRYAVLSKNYPNSDLPAFQRGPYSKVFENEDVVIFATSQAELQ